MKTEQKITEGRSGNQEQSAPPLGEYAAVFCASYGARVPVLHSINRPLPRVIHGPMSQIDVTEAKRDLDQLLERASQGEEVVITKEGRPLARLTAPISTSTQQQRQFGSVEGEIWMSEDFDEPLDDFEESV